MNGGSTPRGSEQPSLCTGGCCRRRERGPERECVSAIALRRPEARSSRAGPATRRRRRTARPTARPELLRRETPSLRDAGRCLRGLASLSGMILGVLFSWDVPSALDSDVPTPSRCLLGVLDQGL